VRGFFITLEGGEGAGKSTQALLLEQALAAQGKRVLRTREPGGAPGSEALRGLLLAGEFDWSPLAETMLHVAARAEHVAKTILPALEAGVWVVCDRFSDSTMAYQGYGQGFDRAAIADLSRLIGLVPDLTLVLTVSPAVADARMAERGLAADRYEKLPPDFHAKVAAGFAAIARADPRRCALIGADGTREETHAAIITTLAERLA
jgi:dTMP kinase